MPFSERDFFDEEDRGGEGEVRRGEAKVQVSRGMGTSHLYATSRPPGIILILWHW